MNINTKAAQSDKATERELKNRQVAYRAALEGIVLLQNDGALPALPGRLALFGPGASHTIKGGTGSGEVNERYSVSILEGLEKAGFTITSKQWLSDYAADFIHMESLHAKEMAKRLRKFDWISIINPLPFRYPHGRLITDADMEASAADTCVYVVARQSGECYDRDLQQDYRLSETELQNIRRVAKEYKNTILVINAGGAVDMGFLDEITGINAVFFFCQQGCEGGTAFADILTGKTAPSGRLTTTWAKKYEDFPFAAEYSIVSGIDEYADFKEDIYVGYRYFDSFDVAPRYPFGYGLGYTSFAISDVKVSLEKTEVKAVATVSNTGGQHAGKEVVQLYLSFPENGPRREYQSLAAFAKTNVLMPEESQQVTFTFNLADFGAYNEASACYVLAKGDYTVRIGQSSRDTAPAAVLALDGDVVLSKHEHICPLQKQLPLFGPPQDKTENTANNLPRIAVKAADFKTRQFIYENPRPVEDTKVTQILSSLTADEMVELAVGSGMFGKKPYLTVPGSGAYTTSALQEKGLCNIVLSDGPAGVRLQRTSAVTAKGEVKMIDTQLGAMNYLPKFIRKLLSGNPEKDTLIYQFTTAFPVGTALAQSWNAALLREVGEAAGAELAEYGVTFWLAPGMNIHRNPLCGRNYEYFSEDPVLSGKMAAALTKGVQSHEGCFVTIKHFACNNQETRRQRMSSNVAERPLREIYLKGFEIAVKEGGAKGLMTSYNKINDVYTPNSYDLCTRVLRNEWGFDGLVMSDWFSTLESQNLADSGLALAAGNDLIMPGGKSFKKNIKAGLKSGKLTEADLRRCCGNIIKMILKSRTYREFMKAKDEG